MNTEVNLIFQDNVQRIFNHFASLLDIKTTFFTTDFVEVRAGKGHCKYCNFLRTKLNCESLCKQLDQKKQMQALEEKRLVSYQCHGGMTEAILPVFTVDKLVGYIMIGQFRITDKCPENYRNTWKKKYGNDKLYEAFLESPYYPEKKLSDIFGMFELFVDSIVNQRLITIKTPSSSIYKLISYIDQNPQINLTLSQAANLMYCSPSSISHEFKQATGVSFKKYLILKKLEKAEELMTNHNLKIHEIAKKVGYSDPYLFSRIYKKHRQYPPINFKKQSNSEQKILKNI